MARALGRIQPHDRSHVEASPLSALALELRPIHVPVPLGIDWYDSFDVPIPLADGTCRLPDVSKGESLGSIRGGHDICLEPAPQAGQAGLEQDIAPWVDFYNQLDEPACVGFAHARALSLLYRRTFDPLWLYDDARRCEGSYPDGEGSSNRGAAQALIRWGAHYETSVPGAIATRTPWRTGVPGVKVKAVRYATDVQEVLATLGLTGESVPLLNNWGRGYPLVQLPCPTLAVLLDQGGEASVITER